MEVNIFAILSQFSNWNVNTRRLINFFRKSKTKWTNNSFVPVKMFKSKNLLTVIVFSLKTASQWLGITGGSLVILMLDTDQLSLSKRKTLLIRFHKETLIINSKFMALQILLSELPGILFHYHSNDYICGSFSRLGTGFWKSCSMTIGVWVTCRNKIVYWITMRILPRSLI